MGLIDIQPNTVGGDGATGLPGADGANGIGAFPNEVDGNGNIIYYDPDDGTTVLWVVVPDSGDVAAGVATGAGKIIYIQGKDANSGNYDITSTITIDTDNTYIMGNRPFGGDPNGGKGQVWLQGDTGVDIIAIEDGVIGTTIQNVAFFPDQAACITMDATTGGNDNTRLEDIYFIPNGANSTGLVTSGTNVSDGCSIIGGYVNGTSTTNCTGFDINYWENVYISGLSNIGTFTSGQGFITSNCTGFLIDFSFEEIDVDNTNSYFVGRSVCTSGTHNMNATNSSVDTAGP